MTKIAIAFALACTLVFTAAAAWSQGAFYPGATAGNFGPGNGLNNGGNAVLPGELNTTINGNGFYYHNGAANGGGASNANPGSAVMNGTPSTQPTTTLNATRK